MKNYYWLFLFVIAVCFIDASSSVANAQDNSGKKNKQVKLLTNAVEPIDVSHTAEECPEQKGTTVRVRVVSNSPVDIRRYANRGNNWMSQDFTNQKQGDEISTYFCADKATFKFLSRPAGSSEAFPKP